MFFSCTYCFTGPAPSQAPGHRWNRVNSKPWIWAWVVAEFVSSGHCGDPNSPAPNATADAEQAFLSTCWAMKEMLYIIYDIYIIYYVFLKFCLLSSNSSCVFTQGIPYIYCIMQLSMCFNLYILFCFLKSILPFCFLLFSFYVPYLFCLFF